MKTLKTLMGALLLGLGSCQTTPLYLDATQSPEARAADLVRRMSLEEKVGQLQCPTAGRPTNAAATRCC